MSNEQQNQHNPGSNDNLDSALATMVASYTDSAPQAPDVNQILVDRAARPSVQPMGEQSWRRPMLAGVFGLLVIAGGVMAVRLASDSGGQTIVPAEESEGNEENDGNTGSDNDADNNTDNNTDNAGDAESNDGADEQSDGSTADEAPTSSEDLGTIPGAENAGALPDTAPATYWAVAGDDAELVLVDARTGEILANAAGWGPQELGEGDLGQALQRAEVSPDGAVYVADCCEPAFGSIFRLTPGETFEPGQSAWQTGLYPEVSPSGDLVMLAVGGSLQIVTAEGSSVASLGEPDGSFEGLQFVPLAWIDEQTIAVRIFADIEEIRIYELDGDALTERTEARRTIADRFHMDASVRADGMLVVATRRPNGDPLGLPGGGDLIGEVIDPTSGELVTEFDLPDMVIEIDYDSSGRFLLTSGDDGVIRWFGAGESGQLATGAISASWD